ncbi:GHKL domain-containing protein [Myxococcota bacterium]|nr:GHKL domain-containing protein [Myxococcota bacterium]MBU1379947.1 GHKL domain-containing protein [Myxococcota bacterium]MBU1497073.1 GHKL domain-containing protein [Myxococcota bacterium]
MDFRYSITRRIIFLTLFKTALITILMGFSVAANTLSPRPDLLQTKMQWAVLGLICLEYAGVLITAVFIKYWPALLRNFLIILLTVDTLITGALVHFTGGVMSPYYILFLIVIISCAVTLDARPTFYITFLTITLHAFVSAGGYLNLLPNIQGQIVTPENMAKADFARQIAISISAFATVSALSIYLAQRLNTAEVSALQKTRELTMLKIRHRDILNSLNDAIISISQDGLITSINRRGRSMLGTTAKPGANIIDFLPELNTHKAEREVSWHTYLNDTLPVEISFFPARNLAMAGTVYIISIRDRSEIEKMETEMAKQEKLAALGRMSASIAHEIRNPLASISGSLELLRTSISTVEGDENTELFNIVFEEIERLNGIVTEILNYTRKPKLEIRETNVSDLMSNILILLSSDSRWVERKIEVNKFNDIKGYFDENSFKQIIYNLIINAFESSSDAKVKIDVTENENMLLINICDSGPGINPDVVNQIFEPFFTTKNSGTGLGLSIVKKLVESHGGTIDIQSSKSGTCVNLAFPKDFPYPHDHSLLLKS